MKRLGMVIRALVVMVVLTGAALAVGDAAWADCGLSEIESKISGVEHQIRMLSLGMQTISLDIQNVEFSNHKSDTLSSMEQTRMNLTVGHEVRMLGIQLRQLLELEQRRECRSYWFWQTKPDYCQSLQ